MLVLSVRLKDSHHNQIKKSPVKKLIILKNLTLLQDYLQLKIKNFKEKIFTKCYQEFLYGEIIRMMK